MDGRRQHDTRGGICCLTAGGLSRSRRSQLASKTGSLSQLQLFSQEFTHTGARAGWGLYHVLVEVHKMLFSASAPSLFIALGCFFFFLVSLAAVLSLSDVHSGEE